MRLRFKRSYYIIRKGTLFGIGIGFGLFLSFLLAVTVGSLNTFTSGSQVSSSQINANFTTLKTAIETLNTEVVSQAVPSGTIFIYAGSSVPIGYLLCDGSTISRTMYASLFTAIGTTWGAGDGSTTFKLPDLREAAPVGAGQASSHSVFTAHENHTLGTYLDDQFQGHSHLASGYTTVNANRVYTGTEGGLHFFDRQDGVVAESILIYEPTTLTTNGTPRYGTTTRGKRIVVNYIVK